MKKFYSCLLLLLGSFLASHAQFVTNGNAASLGGGIYRLTEEAGSRGGSVWYQTRLNLNFNFSVNAELYLGRLDANGADGIAFVLQPLSSGIGSSGGGIGYAGISPSLAVEFDTWQNGEYNDPVADHLGFMKNGDLRHSSANNPAAAIPLPNLEDAAWHPVTFNWNAGTKTLSVTFLGNTYTYTNDIVATIFGGSPYAYWGFTGATGAAINLQQVHIIGYSSVDEGITATITKATCSNTSNGAIDITVTPADTYTYSWSNGATTEDIKNLLPGNYTVTATKGAKTLTATFTVGTNPDNILPVLDVAQLPTLSGKAPFTVTTIPTAHDNCSGTINGTTSDPLTYNTPGTYTIHWTYSDGTNSVTQTQTVEVTSSGDQSCTTPPTLRNDPTIVLDADCAGNGGLVTLIPTSGTSPFMYSIDGGTTYVEGPATGYSFQELHAGTYQLRIKDANGCESAVLTKEVHKYFGGPLFKNDGTIVLDASCGANDGNISIIPTCGAAPFMYSIDGGMTYVNGPATGYTFQNLAPGTYQLRLKDFYGTESAIVTRQVRPDFYGPCAMVTVAGPRGNAAQAKDGAASLQAYPNPSKGKFQVQLGRFSSPKVQLQVIDARGAVLQQRTLNAEQNSVVDIDLSGKAKGLYLIRVLSDKGTQQTKVMIQ